MPGARTPFGLAARHICVLLTILIACANCAPSAKNDDVRKPAPRVIDESNPPSVAERDQAAIRQQVEAYWAFDPSTPGIDRMSAKLTVELARDGSVTSVEIDPASSNGDPNWMKFAESCKRAVLKASPLKMPPNIPYAAWKRIVLVFDARDLFSQ